MSLSDEARWGGVSWVGVFVRSVLVGAVAGVAGGALVYFLFGFIGFSGASFSRRLGNGWDAVVDTGLGKGIFSGLALALGLLVTIGLLALLGRRVDPPQARPWLSVMAGLLVVIYNRESLRSFTGWDPAGVATVLGIALLVGTVVWLVSPWVLTGRRPQKSRDSTFDEAGYG